MAIKKKESPAKGTNSTKVAIDLTKYQAAKATSGNNFMNDAPAFPPGDVSIVWGVSEKGWVGLKTPELEIPISIPVSHLKWEYETNGVDMFDGDDETEVFLTEGLKMSKEKKEDKLVQFSN